MRLYAETSALLAWLFGESRADEVRRVLAGASSVVTSELAPFEIERSVIRNVTVGRLSEADATDIRALARSTVADWTLAPITPQVLASGRTRFPKEPVRSLDAIHLGTLLVTLTPAPDVAVLSLDDRVRENARLLGFMVVP